MKKLILLLLFVPIVSLSQNDGYKLCYELGNRGFSTNNDAIKSLEKVLAVANLKTNRFVILPCDNIGNAMASVYQGFRYILYKESWMNKTDYWSKMAILAHEVGHHINGHTLSGYSLAESRKVELEADDWAGYAMAKLGASLAQTLEITSMFQTGDDSNSTHPNRAKRVAALKAGWNAGNGAMSNKPTEKYTPYNSNMSASEYFNRANDKVKNGDNYGAIVDFSKVIELNPNDVVAYKLRGISKKDLKDDYGAIADYTKAIELEPNDADAYYYRGFSYNNVNRFNSAIADFTKAIELNYYFTAAYLSRAISKQNLKDWYGVIEDCNTVINFINPNDVTAYGNRGIAKYKLNDMKGCCYDFRKAISLGSTNNVDWVEENCK